MKQRASYPIAVFAIFKQDDAVLLLRRANTGYRDGELSLPAGHVEAGESATAAMCRELCEELGITCQPQDLNLVVTLHRKEEEERLDLFFEVKNYTGTICNNEPEKCSELVWSKSTHLPKDTIDYVRQALDSYCNQQRFFEFGW